jgi:hypothetical protein
MKHRGTSGWGRNRCSNYHPYRSARSPHGLLYPGIRCRVSRQRRFSECRECRITFRILAAIVVSVVVFAWTKEDKASIQRRNVMSKISNNLFMTFLMDSFSYRFRLTSLKALIFPLLIDRGSNIPLSEKSRRDRRDPLSLVHKFLKNPVIVVLYRPDKYSYSCNRDFRTRRWKPQLFFSHGGKIWEC